MVKDRYKIDKHSIIMAFLLYIPVAVFVSLLVGYVWLSSTEGIDNLFKKGSGWYDPWMTHVFPTLLGIVPFIIIGIGYRIKNKDTIAAGRICLLIALVASSLTWVINII